MIRQRSTVLLFTHAGRRDGSTGRVEVPEHVMFFDLLSDASAPWGQCVITLKHQLPDEPYP